MADYTDFWVVMGTSAPVLLLAHAVVVAPAMRQMAFSESRVKTITSFCLLACAGISMLACFFVFIDSAGWLGDLNHANIDRMGAARILEATMITLLIETLLAYIGDIFEERTRALQKKAL